MTWQCFLHTHQHFFRCLKKLLICACHRKKCQQTHKTYFDLVRRINTNQVASGSFISMHISPILGSSIVLIPTIIEQIKWGTGGNIKCSLSTSSCVTAVNLSSKWSKIYCPERPTVHQSSTKIPGLIVLSNHTWVCILNISQYCCGNYERVKRSGKEAEICDLQKRADRRKQPAFFFEILK